MENWLNFLSNAPISLKYTLVISAIIALIFVSYYFFFGSKKKITFKTKHSQKSLCLQQFNENLNELSKSASNMGLWWTNFLKSKNITFDSEPLTEDLQNLSSFTGFSVGKSEELSDYFKNIGDMTKKFVVNSKKSTPGIRLIKENENTFSVFNNLVKSVDESISNFYSYSLNDLCSKV
jgi:hypothetical protein